MSTLGLVALLALGQMQHPSIRSGGLSRYFPSQGGNGVALTYLATVATSEECTGTSPTTLQGGSLTFTRASSAHCAKSDGTLVLLTTDQPRIEPGGILIEAASTNSCIRSNALDNGAWTATNTTVTANTTVAPEGTATAETLTSTVAGGFVESTAVALVGGAAIVSSYCKTTSGTQSMAIRLRNTTGASDACTGTITATTTYQRAKCQGLITTGNNHAVRIYPGGTAATGTVVCTDVQQEVTGDGSGTANPSSYIATAGTVVTRALEVATLALPANASQTQGCLGVTLGPVSQVKEGSPRVLDFDASNPIVMATTTQAGGDDGAGNPGALTILSVYTNINRLAYSWGSSLQYLQTTGATGATGAYDGSLWTSATLYLGANSGSSSFINANLSNIKVGTRPGACL